MEVTTESRNLEQVNALDSAAAGPETRSENSKPALDLKDVVTTARAEKLKPTPKPQPTRLFPTSNEPESRDENSESTVVVAGAPNADKVVGESADLQTVNKPASRNQISEPTAAVLQLKVSTEKSENRNSELPSDNLKLEESAQTTGERNQESYPKLPADLQQVEPISENLPF